MKKYLGTLIAAMVFLICQADDVAQANDRINKIINGKRGEIIELHKRNNDRIVAVIREIIVRRPDVAELGNKYIEVLEKNEPTYNMNWDIQEKFYQEKDFAKLIANQNAIGDMAFVFSYEVFANYLYNEGIEAENFRKDWAVAGKKHPVIRMPNELVFGEFLAPAKVTGTKAREYKKLLFELEAELLENSQYRQAMREYYLNSAEIARITMNLKSSSPEYLAWMAACRKNTLPNNESPLTQAWQEVKNNDPAVVEASNKKSKALAQVTAIFKKKIAQNGKIVQAIMKL